MRRGPLEGTMCVLNADWVVPQFDPTRGVWVTAEFKEAGATLAIFDEAPDSQHSQCLAIYLFPLNEPVLIRDAGANACGDAIEPLPISEQDSHFCPNHCQQNLCPRSGR